MRKKGRRKEGGIKLFSFVLITPPRGGNQARRLASKTF
jgi:hypothetical protein